MDVRNITKEMIVEAAREKSVTARADEIKIFVDMLPKSEAILYLNSLASKLNKIYTKYQKKMMKAWLIGYQELMRI